ncbi:MAG: hypothetical protein IJ697_03870 [Synergistaceae bacterium]|nr:hypothetical protein [Synergistaceae bacterium]
MRILITALFIVMALYGTSFAEMRIKIDGVSLPVEWENNKTVNALKNLAPLTVKMSAYGGFEQVGSLGHRLPRNDSQMTTSAGDIVLYSGDNIVIFYGSNSWAYTKLGMITGKSQTELAELLSKSGVTLTISDD